MAIAEEVDPKLYQSSLVLLKALDWEGTAMVEFRKDLDTGNAVLMEVNGRYWGSCSCSIHAGLNFPLYQWQLAHGYEPRVPQKYRVGMKWRWTPGYIDRLHFVPPNSASGIGPSYSRWRELADVPLDYSPAVRSALWSWSDPRPALVELSNTLVRWSKAYVRWMVRRLFSHVVKQRDLYHRLGPKAGRIYLKLRLFDWLGLRGTSTSVPSSARSFAFVCHGNIMRSPMAEAIMTRALAVSGRSDIFVISAGLHANPGKEAHLFAQLACRDNGLTLRRHRAQLLNSAVVAKADAIFAMDFENKAELLALYPTAARKILMLGAYADPPLRNREIPDPFHGSEEITRGCYAVLESCIHSLVMRLCPASVRRESPARDVVSV